MFSSKMKEGNITLEKVSEISKVDKFKNTLPLIVTKKQITQVIVLYSDR